MQIIREIAYTRRIRKQQVPVILFLHYRQHPFKTVVFYELPHDFE